jgi:hypothetical protein
LVARASPDQKLTPYPFITIAFPVAATAFNLIAFVVIEMLSDPEATLATLSDQTKVFVDVMKHLTTLASGAIVLIATFIDKIENKHWRLAIPLAIGCLLLCIISAMFSCLTLASHFDFIRDLRAALTKALTAVAKGEQRNEAGWDSGIDNVASSYKVLYKTTKSAVALAALSFGCGMILIGLYVMSNLKD